MIIHLLLNALLRLQSAICPRIFARKGERSAEARNYIFGQGSLKGRRLYLAKAENTACEVVAIYNAVLSLGLSGSFEEVKRAFLRRGALSIWPLGFFGGNPFSLGRVLSAFGIAYEKTRDISPDGRYILSFYNGPKNPRIHTVFAISERGRLLVYNLYQNDRSPRLANVRFGELLITAYKIEKAK